jgi:hypothetical protein
MQVLNPSGSFGIVYLAQVSLGGRQVCMTQNDFADYFNFPDVPETGKLSKGCSVGAENICATG